MTTDPLILATRGSRMALRQTEMVMEALKPHVLGREVTLRIIKTSGDWKPEDGEKRLSEAAGGKGLFAKEIEQHILAGIVHAGVHCLKDLPSFLPDGLAVDHMLPRDDPRDILISRTQDDLFTLPSGSVIGTASLRRTAMIKKLRPDLVVTTLRGNVPTRLDKLRSAQVDAMVLSASGLPRLGYGSQTQIDEFFASVLDPAVMLPACGQGVVALETRLDDAETRACFDRIHHVPTGLCVAAERQVLQILDGDCQTPVGVYATLNAGTMQIRALIATPDGQESFYAERAGYVKTIDDALVLGRDLGAEVRRSAPYGILPCQRTGT